MKKKRNFCSVALLVLLVLGLVATVEIRVASSESIPLPSDVNIVPPPPDTPKEIAAFSGKWGGTWWSERNDRRGDVILIVEELDSTQKKAKVVYAWGALVDRKYSQKEGWKRGWGKIATQDGQVFIAVRGPTSDFRFFFTDGKLQGERTAAGGEAGLRWSMTMKPIQ